MPFLIRQSDYFGLGLTPYDTRLKTALKKTQSESMPLIPLGMKTLTEETGV